MKHETFVLTVIARAQKSGAIDWGYDEINGSIINKCGMLWHSICTGDDVQAKTKIGKIAAVIAVGECISSQLLDEYEPISEPYCSYSSAGKELISDLFRQCIDKEYLLAYSTIKKIAVGCNFDFLECCELALEKMVKKDSKNG